MLYHQQPTNQHTWRVFHTVTGFVVVALFTLVFAVLGRIVVG